MTETTPNNPATRFDASLSITSGANAGQQHAIRGPVTIGRAADNSLVLPDPDASRYHARIEPREDGLWLTDLGSANGTRANGVALTAPRSLQNGDTLQIGATTLTVSMRATIFDSATRKIPLVAPPMPAGGKTEVVSTLPPGAESRTMLEHPSPPPYSPPSIATSPRTVLESPSPVYPPRGVDSAPRTVLESMPPLPPMAPPPPSYPPAPPAWEPAPPSWDATPSEPAPKRRPSWMVAGCIGVVAALLCLAGVAAAMYFTPLGNQVAPGIFPPIATTAAPGTQPTTVEQPTQPGQPTGAVAPSDTPVPPQPTDTGAPLPTDTSAPPTATPTEPLPTASFTPTHPPASPTPKPPAATKTQASAGPLSVVRIDFAGAARASGNDANVSVSVVFAGGRAPYTVLEDGAVMLSGASGQTSSEPGRLFIIYISRSSCGATWVHTVTLNSADGQSASGKGFFTVNCP